MEGFEIRSSPVESHVVYYRVTDGAPVAHYSRHSRTAYVGGKALNVIAVDEQEGREFIETVLAARTMPLDEAIQEAEDRMMAAIARSVAQGVPVETATINHMRAVATEWPRVFAAMAQRHAATR